MRTAGSRLGRYELLDSLGAGGMGEVFRARDAQLGREVALKVLPEKFVLDPQRRARFEREARLLGSLSHPNIAALFGLEESDGVQMLALELVDGETLAERLASLRQTRTRLPLDEAIAIADQIAAALEAAHERGVVHRDLKPSNVALMFDGTVKVLDFGLAKVLESQQEDAGHHAPTVTDLGPPGATLGTPAYMSPEQARGLPVDKRTDIWAFGCMLFEMLAGERAFAGETSTDVIAKVLEREPAFEALPADVAPAINRLLRRCLEKDPRRRLRDIGDARLELAESRAPRGSGSSKVPRFAAAAAIAVVVGVTGWFLRPFPAPEPKTVVRFSIPLPAEPSYPANNLSTIAVSPDGQQIAYVAGGGILLRNIGEREEHAVRGTAEPNVVTPVFSPDGQWLAYVQVDKVPVAVKRIPISGGTPVPIHEAERTTDALGLSWPTAGTMLFTSGDGIVQIPANGGTPEVLVARGEGERLDSPQLLPGGETVLFTRVPGNPGPFRGIDAAQIVVQSIGGDDRTVVVEGGSAARYLPTGHLVYAQGTALFAIPFDPQARTVRGGPVQMVEGLRRSANGSSDTAYFAVSETGTLVTVPNNPNAGERTLTWVDREGREEPFPVRADDYTMVRISPDGTKVALGIGSIIGSPVPALWLFDLRTENLSLLTGDPAGDDGPVWSADGRRIFFRSLRGGGPSVYSIELETGETKLLASSSPDFPFLLPWTISPDDRTLGLVRFRRTIDIITLSIADGALTRLLHDQDIVETDWSFSPNGAWIAYQEGLNNDSRDEINIRPFPAVSRTRIPVGRGASPVFSRDGSELFFFDGQGLSAAPVTYEPTLRVGAPQRLFETTARFPSVPGGRSWDVDPSGERFLMIRAPEAAGQQTARIDVVVNWFEELESRVPTQ